MENKSEELVLTYLQKAGEEDEYSIGAGFP